ncbi:unnamed protein product [Toxocara canis]|uniref:Alpha-1,3-glucosyltransferase n=1 Tax=Toxocara canis TaxID=6265 RepID=A0A183ULZ7_TOXCA|nr:unnamed protein product [Toxocara canis]
MVAEKLQCERSFSGSDSIEREIVNVFATRAGFLCLFFLTVSVHIAISSGSYSELPGRHCPPMFGDFEAQRHWMEICIHLPVREWYVNGSENDLNYWGLDYPPLTAFHSFVLGKLSDKIDRSWVALHVSRGIETDAHKLLMRLSVMVSVWALYIPALITFAFLSSGNVNIYYCTVSILYPALIAVDNGHFQFNHISLGLFLVAVICLISDRRLIGSVLFVMAVNFKQMELYHSLPVAAFLLARSVRSPWSVRSAIQSLTELTKVFLIVAAAFLLIWCPFVMADADLWQILHRIFPFYRGIFEVGCIRLAVIFCVLVFFARAPYSGEAFTPRNR